MNNSNDFRDIYQQVTDTVIKSLVEGNVIWRQSWNKLGLPKNATTNRQYQGWNVFWLNFHNIFNEYKTPYYITFNQAQKIGGTIRKGEKGVKIIYWATVEDKSVLIEDLASSNGDTSKKRTDKMIPTMHTVFNLDQTDGIELPKVEALFRSDAEKIKACDDVVQSMPLRPAIKHFGDKAYYVNQLDGVTMPDISLFHSNEAYYATLFHELAHSTGHPKRLNRKELIEYDGFGGQNYSKEELTAELTAAYLSAVTGIQQQTLSNNTAYIKGWLKALKNDKKLIVTAASQAQKAANYILGSSTKE